MRTEILGVYFDNLTMDKAVENAMNMMDKKNASIVVTPNPEIVWNARNDKELAGILNEADLVLPDGIGIMYGAKILKRPLSQKLPGIDFCLCIIEKMANTGKKLFLFGAAPGVAELAAGKLKEEFPGLVIVGTHDGYFKDDEPVVDIINSVAPDFLMVCLGSPKQELWMNRNKEKLSVGVMSGLGGSLDVFAGNVKRAPKVIQNAGFEWLYRLIKNPSRIGRMAKIPMFLFAVMGQRISGSRR